MENKKRLFRVNYIVMHPTIPTFTIANKDHKTIHIHENTFVLLEGGVSIQQTSF